MIGIYAFLAGVSGLAMVALAAYGAHGGGPDGLPDAGLFQTAWRIHAVHTAVLVALGMCRRPNIWLYAAFWLMLGGTFFFSGSLYAVGLGKLAGGSIITPVGGVLLMAGWFALAISSLYRLSYQSIASRKKDD